MRLLILLIILSGCQPTERQRKERQEKQNFHREMYPLYRVRSIKTGDILILEIKKGYRVGDTIRINYRWQGDHGIILEEVK